MFELLACRPEQNLQLTGCRSWLTRGVCQDGGRGQLQCHCAPGDVHIIHLR